jgi:hypothetical protein
MKRLGLALVAVLVAFAGLKAWMHFHPTEETRITRHVAALSDASTISPMTTYAARKALGPVIEGFFTEEVSISVRTSDGKTRFLQGGRFREFLKTALESEGILKVKLKLLEPEVTLSPDAQTASVTVAAILDLNRDEAFLAEEWKIGLVKQNGFWLIREIETLPVFRQ